MVTENKQQQHRRDSAADWVTADPVLLQGEIGFEENTGAIKIGDGATAWTSLNYANVPSVTSMPTSPQTGMRVYRSDNELEYFYDGTRWLTTRLFSMGFSAYSQPSNDFLQTLMPIPFKDHYDVYIESMTAAAYKTFPGTWGVEIHYGVGLTYNFICSVNFGHNASYSVANASFTPIVVPSTAECFRNDSNEISGSGSMKGSCVMHYRLVGT